VVVSPARLLIESPIPTQRLTSTHGGGKINFSAHEIKSVPEPATIAMALPSRLPNRGLLWAGAGGAPSLP